MLHRLCYVAAENGAGSLLQEGALQYGLAFRIGDEGQSRRPPGWGFGCLLEGSGRIDEFHYLLEFHYLVDGMTLNFSLVLGSSFTLSVRYSVTLVAATSPSV